MVMSRLSKLIRMLVRHVPRRPVPPASSCKSSLVLHIGPHKTGTTAIQVFCERNRQHLAKAGFWYVKSGSASAQHMLLPACYLSEHHCIPKPLLGGCPEEIVATIAAEVPRGLTPVMSSEVFWELLCDQPEAFESAVAELGRYFNVHTLIAERPVRERLWSEIKFNSRLGFACDSVADFHGALEVDRRARERLADIGYPVIRVPYEDADCISPFLRALSSPCISRQNVRPSQLDALIQRCHAGSATLRENVAPSAPWFVAFTIEFSQRSLAAKAPSLYDRRIATFLRKAMEIGNQLDATQRLPDEQTVLNRVVESNGSLSRLLTPTEMQAWESVCDHPAVQRAAMRTGCADELRAVCQRRIRNRYRDAA
jgi:N-acyl-L-homoserine lactone synthetase